MSAAAEGRPAPSPPLVSVIIPCYNQARFLPDAVASLQAQTLATWECMIVDDGSADNTAKVAESLAQGDDRIRVVSQSNHGPSAARNAGLRLARGRYIQFLDADDLIAPEKLLAQVSALSGAPPLALSYCDYRYCPEDDVTATATRDDFPPPRFLMKRPVEDIAARWETDFSIPIHCFLFDASFFRSQRISFDENLPNHEDWDCWMRIFALDPVVVLVSGTFAIYRLHRESLTRDRGGMGSGFDLAIQKQLQLLGDDPDLAGLLLAKRQQMVRVYQRSMIRRFAKSVSAALARLVPTALENIMKGR